MAVVVVLGLAAAGAELPKEKPDGGAEDPLLALLVPNAKPVVAGCTAADTASGFAPNPPPMGQPNWVGATNTGTIALASGSGCGCQRECAPVLWRETGYPPGP